MLITLKQKIFHPDVLLGPWAGVAPPVRRLYRSTEERATTKQCIVQAFNGLLNNSTSENRNIPLDHDLDPFPTNKRRQRAWCILCYLPFHRNEGLGSALRR